jgi:GTPase Era involved in 16S rRNA processing
MKFRTPVLNLIGGPGTGKSTTMAGTFFELKSRGITAEMAPEWFKGKVWEGTADVLAKDQLYVTAKQNHELQRLMHTGVKAVITDCPLLLALIYGAKEPESFKRLVIDKFMEYNNVIVFLNRVKHFDPEGRLQTEAEAKGIDLQTKEILDFLGLPYTTVDAGRDAPKILADRLESLL